MKRWIDILVVLVATPVLIAFVLFRLPLGPPKVFKAEVLYRFIDIDLSMTSRLNFENRIGNRRVCLVNNEIDRLYVSSDDYKRLWPESPWQMRKKNYTIVGTFRVKKLLFGGYSVANLVDTIHVTGNPVIRK